MGSTRRQPLIITTAVSRAPVVVRPRKPRQRCGGVAGRPTRASACETMVLDCQAVGTTSAEKPNEQGEQDRYATDQSKADLVMCSSFC